MSETPDPRLDPRATLPEGAPEADPRATLPEGAPKADPRATLPEAPSVAGPRDTVAEAPSVAGPRDTVPEAAPPRATRAEARSFAASAPPPSAPPPSSPRVPSPPPIIRRTPTAGDSFFAWLQRSENRLAVRVLGLVMAAAIVGLGCLIFKPPVRDFADYVQNPARGRYKAVFIRVVSLTDQGLVVELGSSSGPERDQVSLPYRIWVKENGDALERKLRVIERDRRAQNMAPMTGAELLKYYSEGGGGPRFEWLDAPSSPKPVIVQLPARKPDALPVIVSLDEVR